MSNELSIDQMGNTISLPHFPKRIISLVPSQTELLYDLGLEDEVVGITKFCIHPKKWRTSKTIVGGTKNFHMDVIHRLKPDLIIGNKEENYHEGISELQQHYPVWMSDITTFDAAIEMINSVSTLTDRETKGREILNSIEQAFTKLKARQKVRTLYLMWRNPFMAAANKTFIHFMMEKIGVTNVLADSERYPEIPLSRLKELNPEVVLLSSEPFPFSEKHIPEIQKILPKTRIIIVDGEMFSWYGSRLALAPDYFNSIQFVD
jgi:ABC-type Fe3+-hydroxamate transport system substrate-binding protein